MNERHQHKVTFPGERWCFWGFSGSLEGWLSVGFLTFMRPDAETPGLGSESAGLTSCLANSEPGFPSSASDG